MRCARQVLDGREGVRSEDWRVHQLGVRSGERRRPHVPAYGFYNPGHYPDETLPTNIVYFEETGADTGLFVSSQPMQIGTRLDYRTEYLNTHWVGFDFAGVDHDERIPWSA